MPKPCSAQAYFSLFSPEEQNRIKASWGGQDLQDEWFTAAQQAGAVPGLCPDPADPNDRPEREPDPERPGARPGGGARPQNTGTGAGHRTPAWLQQNIDTTISEGQWNAWQGFMDPACPDSAPFRSERGMSGCFEKPVDCPPGQTPMGSAPGAPCFNAPAAKGLGPAAAAGGGGGGGVPAQAQGKGNFTGAVGDLQVKKHNAMDYTGNPLIDALIHQFNSQADVNEPYKAGLFGFENNGLAPAINPETGVQDERQGIQGTLLPGGGLWWGPEGTGLAGARKYVVPKEKPEKLAPIGVIKTDKTAPQIPGQPTANNTAFQGLTGQPPMQGRAQDSYAQFPRGGRASFMPQTGTLQDMLMGRFKKRPQYALG